MGNLYDIVLEGGGAKGIAFVGAIEEFENHNLEARCFIGTSAGSIVATLLVVGYRSQELLDILNERVNGKSRFSTFTDIAKKDSFSQQDIERSLMYKIFQKIDIPFVPNSLETKIDNFLIGKLMDSTLYRKFFSLVEKGGLYSGQVFLDWIKEKLNANGRNLGNKTLGELFDITKRHLSIVVSDTTGKEMLVLNHRTTPDCPVAWAVRMSMSIPFVWQEVIWQKEWGNYYKWRGSEKEIKTDLTGHVIVDGGVLSNFPITLVADKGHEDIMGELDTTRVQNLGLLIDESLIVENCGEREDENPEDENNHIMLSRISNLLDTMLSANDRKEIKDHEKEICHLPAKGYGTTEFDMSDKRMIALVNAGRNAMRKYLDNVGSRIIE